MAVAVLCRGIAIDVRDVDCAAGGVVDHGFRVLEPVGLPNFPGLGLGGERNDAEQTRVDQQCPHGEPPIFVAKAGRRRIAAL